MKRGYPPLRLAAFLVVLALLWRMLGAPVTIGEWRALDVPLWQARTLLPGRLGRVLRLWLPPLSMLGQETGGQAGQEALTLLSAGAEQQLMLRVWDEALGRVEEMPLESYVFSVVAAEMPAAYHLEALKAQAVAARTRAVAQQQSNGCTDHPGADVCTGSGHCQAFAGEESLHEKWGSEYPLYRDRVLEAVAATAGQILTWEGKPITVMYHAISGGRTEAVEAVFSQALPYLVSVESAGEEDVRGFRQDAFFTYGEAARLLTEAFPAHGITEENLRRTLTVAAHTPTGRVESLLVGSGQVSGTDFRRALGLRSTLFTFSMDDEGITFHQTGYGHGVGMSQAGANRMAAGGSTCPQILAHYYPGTTLEKH